MNAEEATDELLGRLLDVSPDDLDRGPDRKRHIGSNIWRLRWRDELAVAVPGHADNKYVHVAPFCAFQVREDQPDFLTRNGPLTDSAVNVLISRDAPDATPSESEQVMRSIRDAVGQGAAGVELRIWYWGGSDWQRDLEAAPTWPGDCPPAEWSAACTKANRWVSDLLIPRLEKQPGTLATDLVKLVNDPCLRIFSSAIKRGTKDRWSLRVDGLEIGWANESKVTLKIGKDQKKGPGYERRIFESVFKSREVVVRHDSDQCGPSELTLHDAAAKIRELLDQFPLGRVPGGWVIHGGGSNKTPDEGAWEARLLDGRAELEDYPTQLVLDDSEVIRGSQFPTLWQHPHRHRKGHQLKQKYLDAMVRVGDIPIAVELKALPKWDLRYYRTALVQAVLYRHFIQKTPALDPWFQIADLDRCAVQAVIAFPRPDVVTSADMEEFGLLCQVGTIFEVKVKFVQERC